MHQESIAIGTIAETYQSKVPSTNVTPISTRQPFRIGCMKSPVAGNTSKRKSGMTLLTNAK